MKKYIFLVGVLFLLCMTACSDSKDITETIKTLTYFVSFENSSDDMYRDMNDTELKAELEKKTGVNVDFIQNRFTSANTELMLMIAASNLPDIIEIPWENYEGGPEKALSDKIIMPLNRIIKLYSPNLNEYIKQHINAAKQVMTDREVYYAYPFIRCGETLKKHEGPVFRSDWLDELGLEPPKTLDEWEHVLREFKTKKKAESPAALKMSDFSKGLITGAYRLYTYYYNDSGVIKYGAYENRFLEFLTRMNQWYTEGLIDPDFMSLSDELTVDKLKNDKSGVAFLDTENEFFKLADSSGQINFIGVQYPVLNNGDKITFGAYDDVQPCAAISAACENVEEAARFLDYGYSEEGILTYNFGIENISYVMEDGHPKYTDMITNSPQKSMLKAGVNYMRVNQSGPFIRTDDYFEQFFIYPQQKEAIRLWSEIPSDTTTLPNIIFRDSEIKEITELKADIEEYTKEMIIKFISGIRPLEEFLDFQQELRDRNIERALELYQTAYARYLKRGKDK